MPQRLTRVPPLENRGLVHFIGYIFVESAAGCSDIVHITGGLVADIVPDGTATVAGTLGLPTPIHVPSGVVYPKTAFAHPSEWLVIVLIPQVSQEKFVESYMLSSIYSKPFIDTL